jgi:hypothetical protein
MNKLERPREGWYRKEKGWIQEGCLLQERETGEVFVIG